MARTVLLTGASSGIGRELALVFAREGWQLGLAARREEELQALAERIETDGGRALPIPCDVTDRSAVHDAVALCVERLGTLDMAIANAGVGRVRSESGFDASEVERTFRVNVFGAANLFEAVLPQMIERGSGRIAGIASLAGYRGLPRAEAYASSKAALINLLEGLRIDLAPTGVGVTTVSPGFIRTAMTEKNRFPMPFLMDAPEAAERIYRALDRGESEYAFPLPMAALVGLGRLLPNALYDRIVRQGPRQEAPE